jgi:hypothetical protein
MTDRYSTLKLHISLGEYVSKVRLEKGIMLRETGQCPVKNGCF